MIPDQTVPAPLLTKEGPDAVGPNSHSPCKISVFKLTSREFSKFLPGYFQNRKYCQRLEASA